MKQKAVIKMQIDCDKCLSKAMKLVASAYGVSSIAIEGEDKNHVVVIGEGIDAVKIASILRKKVGHADIIGVEEVKKKAEKESKPEEPRPDHQMQWYRNYAEPTTVVMYDDPFDTHPNGCSIL